MASNEVSTLKKGLHVLELVKQFQGITLKEVMAQLQLSKSTAFRLLSTLDEMNYIYKIQTKYFFNHKIFCDNTEKKSQIDWASVHSLYQVVQELQMQTYLGEMDGIDLITTRILYEPFKHLTDKENRVKLHQSALGKVILANLDEETLRSLFSKISLEPATENTFQDPQLFYYHLKAIRQDSYAFDDEEQITGIRCIAVPVFCHEKVTAALAIAAPAEQISRRNIKDIANKLKKGSKSITKEIEALVNIK